MERIKLWKVSTTAKGVAITLNDREYELGTSAAAIAFDLQRAVDGANVQTHGRDLGSERGVCWKCGGRYDDDDPFDSDWGMCEGCAGKAD